MINIQGLLDNCNSIVIEWKDLLKFSKCCLLDIYSNLMNIYSKDATFLFKIQCLYLQKISPGFGNAQYCAVTRDQTCLCLK